MPIRLSNMILIPLFYVICQLTEIGETLNMLIVASTPTNTAILKRVAQTSTQNCKIPSYTDDTRLINIYVKDNLILSLGLGGNAPETQSKVLLRHP